MITLALYDDEADSSEGEVYCRWHCVLSKVRGTYFAPDYPERIMRWRFERSEGKRSCDVG
jgi:hypothetical protein